MHSTIKKKLSRIVAILLFALTSIVLMSPKISSAAALSSATETAGNDSNSSGYTLTLTEYQMPDGQQFTLIALGNADQNTGEFDDLEFDFDDDDLTSIADPIEPFNRAMFVFNDKLYFWVLKPTAGFYGRAVPEKGRIAVRRFFTNIATPIRLVNALLQLKFKYAGTELARFGINTTVGLLGFRDPARDKWNIYLHKEDFGQSIGHYGVGPGFYITWPILGPSSLRDTFGLIGDFLLNPASYIFAERSLTGVGVWSYDKVNSTSLDPTLYEDLTKNAIDPYLFIRDAYHQHREQLIKE